MKLTASDIQRLAHAFALPVVRVRAHTDKLFQLQTPAGSYALRFANAGATRAHMLATQTVRRALHAAGLPVAAPVTASDGSSIIEWDGRLGEVQPWIGHTGAGTAWTRLVTASTTLRHLHDHLAALHVQPEQHDDPWRTPADLADRLAADTMSLRQHAEQNGITIERYLQQAAAVLARLRDGGQLDRCRRQLTHGDFQGRNLLFQGRMLSGIIDFERLEYRPRLYDLAWPLVFWRWFGTARGPYTAADWRQARACCRAYAAASPAPIADDEWATLPLLMAYIPARGIAQAAGEEAPLGEVLAFGQAMEFAAWVMEHPDEVVARLRS